MGRSRFVVDIHRESPSLGPADGSGSGSGSGSGGGELTTVDWNTFHMGYLWALLVLFAVARIVVFRCRAKR